MRSDADSRLGSLNDGLLLIIYRGEHNISRESVCNDVINVLDTIKMSYSESGTYYSGTVLRQLGIQNATINTTADDYRPILDLDISRNIYLTYLTAGSLSGSIQTNVGGYNMVSIKMNSAGNVLWFNQGAGFTVGNNFSSTNTHQERYSSTVDEFGNQYIALTLFFSSSYWAPPTPDRLSDILVAKLSSENGGTTSPTGGYIRFTEFATNNRLETYPSIKYYNGALYMSYSTTATLNINGVDRSYQAIGLNKLTPSTGVAQWPVIIDPSFNIRSQALEWGDDSNTAVSELIIDNSGKVIVAYTIHGAVEGGTQSEPYYFNNIIVGKFDPDVLTANGRPTLEWVKQDPAWNFNSSYKDKTVPSLAVDSTNNIYMSYDTLWQGDNYGSDIAIVKINGQTGDTMWSSLNISNYEVNGSYSLNHINTDNEDSHSNIIIDRNNNLYVVYFTYSNTRINANKGERDIVIAKINPTTGDARWVTQRRILNTTGIDYATANWGGGNQFPIYNSRQFTAIDTSGDIYFTYATNSTITGGTSTGSRDIALFKVTPIEGIFRASLIITPGSPGTITVTTTTSSFPAEFSYYLVGSPTGWVSISQMTRINNGKSIQFTGTVFLTDQFKIYVYNPAPSQTVPPWSQSVINQEGIVATLYQNTGTNNLIFLYDNYVAMTSFPDLVFNQTPNIFNVSINYTLINSVRGIEVRNINNTADIYTFNPAKYYYIIGGFTGSDWGYGKLMTVDTVNNRLTYSDQNLLQDSQFKIFELSTPLNGDQWEIWGRDNTNAIQELGGQFYLYFRNSNGSNDGGNLYFRFFIEGTVTRDPTCTDAGSITMSITASSPYSVTSVNWLKNGVQYATTQSITGLSPADYTVTAIDSNDSYYSETFSTKYDQTISFPEIPDFVCFDPPYSLSAFTTSPFIAPDTAIIYQSSNSSVAAISGSQLVIGDAGSANITVTISAACFNPETDTQPIVVLKATAPVQFSTPTRTVSCGDIFTSLSAYNIYGSAVTFSSSDPTIMSISGASGYMYKEGVVTITASISNARVNSSTATQTITVVKGYPTITFIPRADFNGISIGEQFSLSGYTTASTPIVFTTDTPSTMSIVGLSATAGTFGLARIIASTASDQCFRDFSTVETIYVRSGQTITIQPIIDKILGTGSFIPPGSSSSGLPLIYTANTPNVTISGGNRVNLWALGSASITANQPGDLSFSASDPVTVTFNIIETPPTSDITESTDPAIVEIKETINQPILTTEAVAATLEVIKATVTDSATKGTVLIAAATVGDLSEAPTVETAVVLLPQDETRASFREFIASLEIKSGGETVVTGIELDTTTDAMILKAASVTDPVVAASLSIPPPPSPTLPGAVVVPTVYISLQRFAYNDDGVLERVGGDANLVTVTVAHPFSNITVFRTDNVGITSELNLQEVTSPIETAYKLRLDEFSWQLRVPFSAITCYGEEGGEEVVEEARDLTCTDPFKNNVRDSFADRSEELLAKRNAGIAIIANRGGIIPDYRAYLMRRKAAYFGYC